MWEPSYKDNLHIEAINYVSNHCREILFLLYSTHLALLSLPLFSIAAMHELTKTGTEVFCLSHRCPMWQPNTLSENLKEKWHNIHKSSYVIFYGMLVQKPEHISYPEFTLYKVCVSQHHLGFCCKFKPSKFHAEQKELPLIHAWAFSNRYLLFYVTDSLPRNNNAWSENIRAKFQVPRGLIFLPRFFAH